ncbi:tRNA (N6-isopentenyl adenosine(37)-C2)-methylthiotransferase MiaB [Magnetovibrio blakemorei]|uniref:tRNA-2-methylthio-N(6)-dimethylallyladenosine synthase n=2 Tax=Magnetovibrio blakemorei TaxID=28181 RepID=A0A1E5Q3X8_9PROT|nr:tRNA (N6-isopentenyl adenosine(37)-C2)-methylthiotransferase MiaB [Magnetovibrio blakemorei]
MNVYDSERIAEVLSPLGFVPWDTTDGADMVILNTCHIREKAAEKVYSELGRLRKQKEAMAADGRRMVLAVTGCVAQAEGEEVLKRAPYVDMVFGPQTYHRLPQMVAEATRASGQQLDTDFPEESKFDALPQDRTVDGATAFLAIQEGCDKFCTYCVVPYTRGAEYSRPAGAVLSEARNLVQAGALEITFLGQNVNNYHGEASDGSTWSLARLIREAAEIDGLERLRFTTSYPAEVDDDLIAAHKDVAKLMPYLHLPVQAGSDRVLKAMNRNHSVDEYRALVDKLRIARPDLALSSDFIVGFPGETDADFRATLKLIEDVTFIQAYSFKYSPRPGTPAALMDLQIDEAVKTERLAELQAVLNAQTLAFNAACVGKTLPVLLDRTGKKPGQLIGRSPYMQAVVVNTSEPLMNRIVDVTITSAGPNSLLGTLEKDNQKACA